MWDNDYDEYPMKTLGDKSTCIFCHFVSVCHLLVNTVSKSFSVMRCRAIILNHIMVKTTFK